MFDVWTLIAVQISNPRKNGLFYSQLSRGPPVAVVCMGNGADVDGGRCQRGIKLILPDRPPPPPPPPPTSLVSRRMRLHTQHVCGGGLLYVAQPEREKDTSVRRPRFPMATHAHAHGRMEAIFVVGFGRCVIIIIIIAVSVCLRFVVLVKLQVNEQTLRAEHGRRMSE